MHQWPEQSEIKLDNINLQTAQLEEKVVSRKFPKRKKKGKNVCVVNKQVTADNQQNFSFVDFGHEIADVFSSWLKLVRSTAYILQSMKNTEFSDCVQLSAEELSSAEQVLFFICRKSLQKNLEETKRRFHKLSLIQDQQGLVRVKGRLEKASLPVEMKNPILLPGDHPLIRLFALHYHQKFVHQGYRVVVANLAKRGIIISKGAELLKSIASRCIFCRIRRRKLLQQRMGVLPAFGIQPRIPPFTSVAIDFFGNLKIRLTRNTNVNGSVMLVTCTTTRCILLESLEKVCFCQRCAPKSCVHRWFRFI